MKPETYTQLDRLLRKIESVCTSWGFFPECDFGSQDAIISTSQMIELENDYKSFCEAYGLEVESQSNRMNIDTLIEKLTKLKDSWVKQANSKIRTAENTYPIDENGIESWEHKSLHFAANCEIMCAKALHDIILSTEVKMPE